MIFAYFCVKEKNYDENANDDTSVWPKYLESFMVDYKLQISYVVSKFFIQIM